MYFKITTLNTKTEHKIVANNFSDADKIAHALYPNEPVKFTVINHAEYVKKYE